MTRGFDELCLINETNLCHYDNMAWTALVMFETTSL